MARFQGTQFISDSDEKDILHGQTEDGADLHLELHKALNPGDSTSDVLADTPIRQSGIHDFAQIPKPTDILLDEALQSNTISIDPVVAEDSKRTQESFKVSKEVLTYVDQLRRTGKPLIWFQNYIESSTSLDDALGAVGKNKELGHLTSDEAKKIEDMLRGVVSGEPVSGGERENLPSAEEIDILDHSLIEQATRSFDKGEEKECLEFLKQVQNQEILNDSVEVLVGDSLEQNNFALAKVITQTLNSSPKKQELLDLIVSKEKIKPDINEKKAESPKVKALIDAFGKSEIDLYKLVEEEYFKKGKNLRFLMGQINTIESDEVHTRIIGALINERLRFDDFDRVEKLVGNIRGESTKKELFEMFEKMKKGELPIKQIEFEEVPEPAIPTTDNISTNQVVLPTNVPVVDSTTNLAQPDNNPLVLAISESDESLYSFIEKEYLAKGKKMLDVVRDAESFDDEDQARIIFAMIKERVVSGDTKSALRLADKIKGDSYKKKIQNLVKGIDSGRVSVGLINVPFDSFNDGDQNAEPSVTTSTPTIDAVQDFDATQLPQADPLTVPVSVPPVNPIQTAPVPPQVDPLAVPVTVVNNPVVMPNQPKTPEAINNELEAARSEYATQMVAWKNAVREKKGWFKKTMSDLGVEKQMPEADRPKELIDAENAYIAAKKQKREGMFGSDVALIVADTEQERLAMDKRMSENIPPLEKGILGKGMEKWSKMPIPVRVGLSTILMTGAFWTVGFVATAGVGAYAGYRGARALGGAVVAQGVGKKTDSIFKSKNEERKIDTLDSYSTGINEANFEERERQLMRAFEKADTVEKRQRLYKALAMAGAGGVATLGSGSLMSVMERGDIAVDSVTAEVTGSTESGLTGNISEIPKSTSVIPEEQSKVPLFENNFPKPSVETVLPSEQISGTENLKVELSSKGFIQDIHNLKAKILTQYGENIPAGIQDNIMDKSSIDLAKQLGFYDAEKGLSGMGYKGETLAINSSGEIVLDRLKGDDLVFDLKGDQTETFKSKGGEMFKPDIPKPPVLEFSMADQTLNADSVKVLPELETVVVPELEEIVTGGGSSTEVVWNTDFTHEATLPGGEKIHVLNDMLQDGDQYKDIRKAFAENFSKSIKPDMNIVSGGPFEGGRIDIVRNPGTGASQVLLNGKEIAGGYIVPGQNSINLLDTPGIKSGWFFADTVYERAFKSAKEMIKTLSNNPSIIPKK